MRKIKITTFDTDGVRGGRSLEAVLSEIGNDGECDEGAAVAVGTDHHDETEIAADKKEEEEEMILQICRLSFTSEEKAAAMGRLILFRGRGRVWNKIILEKTSGRFVSKVLQDAVASTRILEVKQHQRYDSIKWNFGLDWFPHHNGGHPANDHDASCSSPLKVLRMTGVRFRGGDELIFWKSLAESLERGAGATSNNNNNKIGLRVLELNACRFLHPDLQYPILFRGLKVACFGTLERLWMPKSPGLDDDRFQELFGQVLLQTAHDNGSITCSLKELGFSYNACGWKGSRAVASFLESPQSANLKVLYLNRQQGELDLQGILRSATSGTRRHFHLNLSQNYVPSLETLQELRNLSASNSDEESSGKDETPYLGLHVELDSMAFEVPEAVFPGNGTHQHHRNARGNRPNSNTARGKTDAKKKNNFGEYHQTLSKDEIAKLNVACGRVKYVLGRAVAASDRTTTPTVVSSSSNSNNGSAGGSDGFFSSLAALDCVLPDLLTILRLQEKQNTTSETNNTTNDTHQHIPQSQSQQCQYRNWLPTFLRKAVKGKIEILKPWLLSASQGPNDSTASPAHTDEEDSAKDERQPPMVVTDSEQERLIALWKEIEALHANIAYHAGQKRHKHTTGHIPGQTIVSSPTTNTKKSSRRKKKIQPMTPEKNPLVKAAFEAVPMIPTSLLESPKNSSPCLSLPMVDDDVGMNAETSESNDIIRSAPPIFINTIEGLTKLRDDLFRRPPPHKLPKMVAIDSEWYFTPTTEHNGEATAGGHTPSNHSGGRRPKKVKHRSMSVATLQIAYVDENHSPMMLKSFVIDLLSNQPGFQELAKDFVWWLFGSTSCDTMILGFAFGGDLRQLRKYAGISGNYKGYPNNSNSNSNSNNNIMSDPTVAVACLEAVESRCLDLQCLLSTPEEQQQGRVPGLKKCAQLYFQKPLKKDDQTSDWSVRPLRPSQLEYAALDAVILLVLLSQKKHQDERLSAAAEMP